MGEENLTFWEKFETIHPKHIGTVLMCCGVLRTVAGFLIAFPLPLLPEGDFARLAWLLLFLLLPGVLFFITGLVYFVLVRKKPAYWHPLSNAALEDLLSHLSRKERACALKKGYPFWIFALCVIFGAIYMLRHEMIIGLVVCVTLFAALILLGRDRELKALCSTPYAKERHLTPELLQKRAKR